MTHGAMIRRCGRCGRQNRVPSRHLADTGRCGSCRAALPPLAEPLDVDAATFDEVVREASVPLLVDVWAEWCAPCRQAAPHIQRLAAEVAGRALVLKVDSEREPGLAARFGVRGIPSFVVLRDGRVVQQRVGLADPREMASWLAAA